MGNSTDSYAVIGNPVAHSRSPQLHALFSELTGEDVTYGRIEAALDGFAAAVQRFREAGGKGLNVTVPFKLEACAIADEASGRVKRAGAANCLKFEGGRILAENFDGSGLVRDITVNLGHAIAGRSVLMAGAGGAARGALQPILEAGPSRLVIANRTATRARELAAAFADLGAVEGCGYEETGGAFDIVINATSAGLSGEASGLVEGVFHAATLAYDMVYGKGMTPFLTQARKAGAAHLADGVGMLAEQAADSFFWWRGVRPPTRAAIEAIRVPLSTS